MMRIAHAAVMGKQKKALQWLRGATSFEALSSAASLSCSLSAAPLQ
jgi:hypothetical protein